VTSGQVTQLINEQCGPDKMSKVEALDFLEKILVDLEGSIDALNDEMAEEEDS
jgi:hypothetical protein